MNDRSFIDTIKTYPINVEIQTLRTYGMTAGKLPTSQSGSATVSLTTSIVLLPREPMTPRLYDERVGYFNNKIIQFNDDDAPEYDAYISRYRLEPKNLKAYKAGKLVEPKQQIVFYIDPATPKKWVKYLKMGIEDWNVAFEAAGFKNAIAAQPRTGLTTPQCPSTTPASPCCAICLPRRRTPMARVSLTHAPVKSSKHTSAGITTFCHWSKGGICVSAVHSTSVHRRWTSLTN